MAPEGSKTQQGHDLQIGTNCLGGYLLSQQLEDVLINTVGLVEKDSNEPKLEKGPFENYMMTKGGNVLLAHETSTRLGSHGVLSVSVNPGLMKTELQRHMPKPASFVMGLLFKSAKFGAYSELFGLSSPEITFEKNGTYIIPWGRLPEDFKTGLKKADQGGTGTSVRFVDWCERETKTYM
ncbi:short-chain alcohol dehydrogenase [Neonectria magnoliae]|uniref:Short-chain alcohol dehydrogenase n=1 Tax=Neonectria magnoliae TaxID=2732573 RepID=A0ABR1I007_9HYPO